MSTKAAEKIIDAITQLVEGFAELHEQLEEDLPGGDTPPSEEADEDISEELQEALVTEMRASIESVIENEDCAPEDIATVLSALTDALEEVAPEVFVQAEEDEDEDDVEYEDDEDIDIDDDDYEYDEDEEDEEEEEEEEDDD